MSATLVAALVGIVALAAVLALLRWWLGRAAQERARETAPPVDALAERTAAARRQAAAEWEALAAAIHAQRGLDAAERDARLALLEPAVRAFGAAQEVFALLFADALPDDACRATLHDQRTRLDTALVARRRLLDGELARRAASLSRGLGAFERDCADACAAIEQHEPVADAVYLRLLSEKDAIDRAYQQLARWARRQQE